MHRRYRDRVEEPDEARPEPQLPQRSEDAVLVKVGKLGPEVTRP
jgi:hypothetical protein